MLGYHLHRSAILHADDGYAVACGGGEAATIEVVVGGGGGGEGCCGDAVGGLGIEGFGGLEFGVEGDGHVVDAVVVGLAHVEDEGHVGAGREGAGGGVVVEVEGGFGRHDVGGVGLVPCFVVEGLGLVAGAEGVEEEAGVVAYVLVGGEADLEVAGCEGGGGVLAGTIIFGGRDRAHYGGGGIVEGEAGEVELVALDGYGEGLVLAFLGVAVGERPVFSFCSIGDGGIGHAEGRVDTVVVGIAYKGFVVGVDEGVHGSGVAAGINAAEVIHGNGAAVGRVREGHLLHVIVDVVGGAYEVVVFAHSEHDGLPAVAHIEVLHALAEGHVNLAVVAERAFDPCACGGLRDGVLHVDCLAVGSRHDVDDGIVLVRHSGFAVEGVKSVAATEVSLELAFGLRADDAGLLGRSSCAAEDEGRSEEA